MESAHNPRSLLRWGFTCCSRPSAPIFVGGLVRWLVDRKQRGALKDSNLSEEQLVAESDKSSGVLLSSGYIAGVLFVGRAQKSCTRGQRNQRNAALSAGPAAAAKDSTNRWAIKTEVPWEFPRAAAGAPHTCVPPLSSASASQTTVESLVPRAKAPISWRRPRALARSGARELAPASWSAAVPCRFRLAQSRDESSCKQSFRSRASQNARGLAQSKRYHGHRTSLAVGAPIS